MTEKKRSFARLAGVGLAVVSVILLAACSGLNGHEKSETADGPFLEELVTGWTERWDFTESSDAELAAEDPKFAQKYKEQLTDAVHLEFDKLEQYTEKSFEDQELGERAIEYVGLLQESLDSLQYLNVDNVKHNVLWGDIYDRRTIAILGFIDTYDLEIPEHHARVVSEMRTNSELATSAAKMQDTVADMLCNLEWKLVKEPEGYNTYYDYEATATNVSDVDFSNVWLDVAIVDESGVNRGNQYASVTNWRMTQAAVFKLSFIDSPVAKFDVSGSWETASGDFGEIGSLCD